MKKLIASKVFVATAGLFLASSLFASEGGDFTAAFLNLGQGARAEGMGGAFTAMADDAHSTYWNPSGLGSIHKQRLAFDYLSFVEGMNTQYASYILPVPKAGGALGVSLTYANFGSIDRRDATGLSTGGETKVDGYSGGLSWGQSVGDAISVGAGLKSISQNLAGTKSSGIAADAGAKMMIIPNRLTVGAAVNNLGPSIKVDTQNEKIPMTLRGGVAFQAIPRQLTFDVDGEKERSTSVKLHAGGEYVYQQMFIVRAGYQDTKGAGGGLSAGLGFVWHPESQNSTNTDFFGKRKNNYTEEDDSSGLEVRFDYAYVDMGDFNATHRFGIELAF